MNFSVKIIAVLFALVVPVWMYANDFTGVEIVLPDGFKFVSSDPRITVDGSGKQLTAKASGGVTLSIRHEPDRRFLTSGIAGFLEDGKKAMVGQSMISMRSAVIIEERGRTWGLAVLDAKSQNKELVQFLLVTSFHDTQLMFEFQGPKKRERFVESAARQFMTSNPFKIVVVPNVRSRPATP